MNDTHQKEFDRFVKSKGDKYSKEVLIYGENLVDRVESNLILKEFFVSNKIGIFPFLKESLELSKMKFESIGNEKLDENEINQVFGTLILQNELLRLQLKNKIFIKGLNEYNDFIYELTENAQLYFQTRYGVKMGKEISIRDIMIVSVDNDDDDENEDEEMNLLD